MPSWSFWETYRLTDSGIMAALQQADQRLSGDTSAVAAATVDTSSLKTGGPLLSPSNSTTWEIYCTNHSFRSC